MSVYAQAVAQSLGNKSVSGGLDMITEPPVHEGAIRTALKKDLDLNEHKTTPITSVVIRKGDLFITMEP